MRKVAWPTQREVINSTIVVLIAVVFMTSLIFRPRLRVLQVRPLPLRLIVATPMQSGHTRADTSDAAAARRRARARSVNRVAPLEATGDGAVDRGRAVDDIDAEVAVEAAVADDRDAVSTVGRTGDADLIDVVEDDEYEAPEPSPYDRPGAWYVVHTYAGYENKVKSNLASRVRSMNVEERIFEVVIPMEDVIEFKGGRKVVVQKKVFPGYLLVRMDLDDDSWYVVRNTPGVTGFVGSGAKPTPLSRSRGRGHPRRRRPRARAGEEGPARGSSSRRASRCVSPRVRSPTSTARSARSTSTGRSSRCS